MAYIIYHISYIASAILLLYMGLCHGLPAAKHDHAASGTLLIDDYKEGEYSISFLCRSKAATATASAPAPATPLSTKLKSFSFNELKIATKNFPCESILGEGGFGQVFKGWIDDTTKPGTGIVVAVKKHKPQSFQGHREWLTEVNYLGLLKHQNLVKLIGHCSESENRLLVYEFMPKGSLENHLFRKGVQLMPWAIRFRIAVDVARGLSFLHSVDANVIYRDLKASNILLDSEFNAKLSDFGLAREGPRGDRSHVTTRVLGTRGYAAPEYVATGHLTPESDVYSFGVVLLELLSGKRAGGDDHIGGGDETLVDWAKPFLLDNRKVLRIMDSKLGGRYSRKCAISMAAIALCCVDVDPKRRPHMTEVLAALEQLRTTTTAPKILGQGDKENDVDIELSRWRKVRLR